MADVPSVVAPGLEAEAQTFADATANPPYLFDLAPAEGRKAVGDVQSGLIAKPEVDEEWVTVDGGPTGSVRARIVRPAGNVGVLPVILYIHGAGWVFGNAHTHDRLVRELAVGATAAVVFPEYSLSPEARYPVAIEENYAVARWIVARGAAKDLDGTRLAVVGGSVGGNMSAEHRGGWSANVDRMLRAPPRALPAAASAVTEVLARVRLPGEVVLRRLYGVVGEGLGPVVDAVSRHEAVQWIQVRHRGHGPVMPTG